MDGKGDPFEYAKPTATEVGQVLKLYEERHRPVDIADKLELPDRIVMAAIHSIRAQQYSRRALGKRARLARFLKKQSNDSGKGRL
jgi:hypothetical protein